MRREDDTGQAGESVSIYLIRHGETDWNAQLRIQGHRDLPLNASGQAQAQALARALAGVSFAAIYSSDLQRARETAQPLAETAGIAIRLENDLRERHFGCCEGKTREDIAAGDPAVAQGMAGRRPDYVIPGGESLLQLRTRVEACLLRLASRHAGETIAVVTHGGVLDIVYRRVHGVPLEKPRDFPLPNASINRLRIVPASEADRAEWSLDAWGETQHLEGMTQVPFVTRI